MPRLDTKQAAAYIPSTKSTLEKMRVFGGGPKFVKIGKRVLYDTRDIDDWLEAQKRISTADTGTPPPGRRASA